MNSKFDAILQRVIETVVFSADFALETVPLSFPDFFAQTCFLNLKPLKAGVKHAARQHRICYSSMVENFIISLVCLSYCISLLCFSPSHASLPRIPPCVIWSVYLSVTLSKVILLLRSLFCMLVFDNEIGVTYLYAEL